MELDKLNKELGKKDKPKQERLDESALLTVAIASIGFVLLMRTIVDIVKSKGKLNSTSIIKKWNELADLKAKVAQLKQHGVETDKKIADKEAELERTRERTAAMEKESALLSKILPKMDDPEVIDAGRDYMNYAYRLLANTKDAENLLAKSQAFGRMRAALADKMTSSEIDALSDLLDHYARENKALMN
jgi:hypothetical protein